MCVCLDHTDLAREAEVVGGSSRVGQRPESWPKGFHIVHSQCPSSTSVEERRKKELREGSVCESERVCVRERVCV